MSERKAIETIVGLLDSKCKVISHARHTGSARCAWCGVMTDGRYIDVLCEVPARHGTATYRHITLCCDCVSDWEKDLKGV